MRINLLIMMIGLYLMTVGYYEERITRNTTVIKEKCKKDNKKIINPYDENVSKKFSTMFNEPSVWIGGINRDVNKDNINDFFISQY